MPIFRLKDEKSGRIVFSGTEEECLTYSKEHPEIKFILEEVKR